MKLKSKIIIIISVVALVTIGIITAVFLSDRGEDISINFPEKYVVIDENTVAKNSEFIENLGYSEESFSAFLHKSNIKYFAANESNSMQFTLSCYSTELSEQIGNLSDFGSSSYASLAEKLELKGYRGVTVKTKSGESFYELFYTASEEEPFVSLQYVTIKNGNYYILNYYGSQTELEDTEYETVRKVLESLKISDNMGIITSIKEGDAFGIFYAILAAAIAVLGIVVVILLSVSIIRDIRKSRLSGPSGEEEKIKRTKRYRK